MEVTLQVLGMKCEHCEAKVTSTLMDLHGVTKAVVSKDNNSAVVSYNEGVVTVKEMMKAVKKAGFKVKK